MCGQVRALKSPLPSDISKSRQSCVLFVVVAAFLFVFLFLPIFVFVWRVIHPDLKCLLLMVLHVRIGRSYKNHLVLSLVSYRWENWKPKGHSHCSVKQIHGKIQVFIPLVFYLLMELVTNPFTSLTCFGLRGCLCPTPGVSAGSPSQRPLDRHLPPSGFLRSQWHSLCALYHPSFVHPLKLPSLSTGTSWLIWWVIIKLLMREDEKIQTQKDCP